MKSIMSMASSTSLHGGTAESSPWLPPPVAAAPDLGLVRQEPMFQGRKNLRGKLEENHKKTREKP